MNDPAGAPANAFAEPAVFLGSATDDDLYRMNLALLKELWVQRDRVAVLERLLVEHGVLGPEEVDRFQPDSDFAAVLAAERDAFVRSVLLAPASLRPSDPVATA